MSFQGFLKQSTAVDVLVGPFVDSTDGDTEETALTINASDVRLSKNGQTAAAKNDATACAHDADGFYNCEFDATDTNTVGQLTLYVHVAGALAVRQDYHVVEEAVYDAMYGASAVGPVLASSVPTNFSDLAITATTGRVTADVYSISGDSTAADNLELAFDGTGYGFTGCTMPTVTTLTGHTAQTGDTYALANGSAGFVAIDTVVDAILVDTAEIGTAGAGLTDLGGMSTAMKAEVNAEADGAIETYGLDHLVSASVTGTDVADDSIIASLVSASATADWDDFDNTTEALQAIRDRGDSAWTTGAGGTPPQLLQNTTIATLSSQTSFTLTAGSADDDAYNGAVVVVTDQSTSTQKAVGSVSDYTGSTKTVTLSADPGVFTMATGDTIDIIANASTAPTAAAVRAEIDSNSTQLAAIVADTNELQTDWANGGRLDLIVDAVLADTADLQANQGNWLTATGFSTHSAADVRTEMDSNSTQLAAIVADTNELQTDLADGGRLDLLIDAILLDTGTTIPATITTAQNDLDIITGSDGVTLATSQGNYAPATATAMATAQADLDTITGSDGVTLATSQGNYAPATSTALATAQADLDTITGSDGVTLATSQGNYAPATATAMAAAQTDLDTITDTGVTCVALTSAAITDVWSTDTLTEAYAADGAAGTPAQILYLIQQATTEGAISGTTWTIKKLDGTTTAATITLDDGTTPTSKTRAT